MGPSDDTFLQAHHHHVEGRLGDKMDGNVQPRAKLALAVGFYEASHFQKKSRTDSMQQARHLYYEAEQGRGVQENLQP
jgi:hypothetical protein